MHLLGLTRSECQHWDSSSKGTRERRGGNELSGFGVRAGEAGFSQAEVLAKVIVPFLRLSPTKLTGRCYILEAINLAHTVHPTLVIL